MVDLDLESKTISIDCYRKDKNKDTIYILKYDCSLNAAITKTYKMALDFKF